MAVMIYAVDRPELAPLAMPERFRHDVAYFMTVPGEHGAPQLPPGEYWIDPSEAAQWLDDGVFCLPSPLDSQNQTEVELSDEQEAWLRWLLEHQVSRIRLQSA